MKIGTKLMAGFALVLALTAVVGLLGSYDLNQVAESYQQEIAGMQQLMEATDTMVIDLLQVRRSEKDFIMRKKMKYPERVNRFLDATKKQAQQVVSAAPDDSVKGMARQITQEIELYRQNFGALVAAFEERGLHEKSGLYGQFRSAAHNMEQVLREKGFSQGTVLYLTIRRHEKDYMLRGAEKYMQKADQAIAELEELVNRSELPPTAQREIFTQLGSYAKTFDLLVAKDKEIAALIPIIKQAADNSIALAEQIEEQVGKELQRQEAEVATNVSQTSLVLRTITALCLLIGGLFAYFFARSISRPLRSSVAMIQAVGRGELDARLELKGRKDEIGVLAEELNRFADSLRDEVVTAFERLAAGDLTFKAQGVIRAPLRKANEALTEVMSQVQIAGDQIAAGSGQVSDSSQSLSQGATEQASSLEEISASLNQMAAQTSTNAENAHQANLLSTEAQQAAQKGSTQMQAMVAAMGEINEAGQNISRIIKTIDEIAFQTNLLALNAAVEAARAGQHGKGFAVVAEEVRNLAARSARAAEETAELIEGSVEKTANGSSIANQTAEALNEIVSGVTKVSDLVGEIAAASSEQAQGIDQINQGVTQIDQVTQQNTANAEESAAAAEELSGQAEQLHRMLQQFQLDAPRPQSLPVPPEPAPQREPSSPPESKGWDKVHVKPAGQHREQVQIALDDAEFGKY